MFAPREQLLHGAKSFVSEDPRGCERWFEVQCKTCCATMICRHRGGNETEPKRGQMGASVGITLIGGSKKVSMVNMLI